MKRSTIKELQAEIEALKARVALQDQVIARLCMPYPVMEPQPQVAPFPFQPYTPIWTSPNTTFPPNFTTTTCHDRPIGPTPGCAVPVSVTSGYLSVQ
jgi:hypothetical protein